MSNRSDYSKGQLHETDLLVSPTEQLRVWLDEASQSGLIEPTAMCVSTVGATGQPSSRFVLLRGLDERGLVFFTNYESRKGVELAQNPLVCAAFWWAQLERQVRVEGMASRISDAESDAYWSSRPYESQLASAASPQSQAVDGRQDLASLVHRVQQLHPEQIARPSHWGGFRIVPESFEFWQGGPARLHDRLLFKRQRDAWIVQRLAP